MRRIEKTACPLNCFDVCGFLVTTEDDQIKKIEGDPDHPITKGKICGRGKMLRDRMLDPRRLMYPQKKVDGQFIRITWEQALSEISQKMIKVKEEFGPTAVLHSYDYASGGLLKELDQRFFNYFGGMTKVTGSLCWGAGIQAQAYDFGDSISHSVEDIQHAKTIIIWGRNVTTTNMHLYPFLLEAREKGAKLIVIDPRKSGIAKYADLHIPITPGMDGNLSLAISKIIIDQGWYDQEFVTNHTLGFEAFKEEVDQISMKDISKEINIQVEDLKQIAEWIALNGPVMTFVGLGMQRYTNGGNTIRAIDALHALTGNIGISGGGVNYAHRAVGNSFHWQDLIREDLREEYRTFTRPTQADEILEAKNPPIKMMFISRTNLVTQLPNIKQTIRALEHVETKVVFDMFLTDTAKYADYVLPIASVFEEEDIYYGSMFHPIVRYGPKLIDPPGEAWSDLKIWTELARHLNLDGFEKSREEYLEIALKPLNQYGINLEALKERKQVELPLPKVAWEDKEFATPSGKFEFYSSQAERDGLPPIAKVISPREGIGVAKKEKGDLPYQLISIHPAKSLHSQHHWLNQNNNTPVLMISREIALKEGLTDGEQVNVFNDRGRIQGKIKIEEGNHTNVIFVEEGYGLETNGNANWLTANGKSDMGDGSIYYECKVSLKTQE